MGDEEIYLVIAEANETSEIILNIYDVSDESMCGEKNSPKNNLNDTVLNEVYTSLIVNNNKCKMSTNDQLELPFEKEEHEYLILDSEDTFKSAFEKNEYSKREKNVFLLIQQFVTNLLNCQNINEATFKRIFLDKVLHNKILMEMINYMLKQIPPDLAENVYCIDNNGVYKCKYCNFSNWNEPVLIRHYRTKHGPKYLYCLACGQTFRSTSNLYRHELACVAPLAPIVKSARHIVAGKLGRQGGARMTACQLCGKIMRRSALRRHEAEHVELRTYQCPLCSASFRSMISLSAHLRAHSGVRPYQCEHCPRAYTSRSSLHKHRVTHSEASYFCDNCRRGFVRKDALINHIKTHDGRTRRFLCMECGKRFTQKFTLENHLRKHKGLPPRHRCTQCSRRFAKMSVLKVHMKKEHNLNLITKKMFYNLMPEMPSHEITKIIKEDTKGKFVIHKVGRRKCQPVYSATID